MLKYLLHITLALCALLLSCTHSVPPQEDQLYRIEYFYQPHPDSATRILDTLNISVLSEKEHAHYCLLKARTNQLRWKVGSETDSLLSVAESYFSKSDDKYFETMTYWTVSLEALMTRKGSPIVLDYRLKAFQCIEQCRHVDERFVIYSPKPTTEQRVIDNMKYSVAMRLGMSYAQDHYYLESIHYLKPVEQFYYENDFYRMHITTAHALGLSYMRINEPDSCLKYIEKGLRSAKHIGDVEEYAFYNYTLAQQYRYQYKNKQYSDNETMEELLRKAVSESCKGLAILGDTLTKYKSDIMEVLAYSYCELHQYDSCCYYAKQVYETPRSLWKSEAAHYLYQSYLALGDNENALYYANLCLGMNNDNISELMAVTKVKEEYDIKMELQKKESEHKIKQMWLYFLTASLIIALLLLWLFISRYRKNNEIELLKIKNSQRETLIQGVAAIYKSQHNDRLTRILKQFENSYPDAWDILKTSHPNLNETELQIIILSFLGFRVKEQANLMGLRETTVMQYRYNIKKKANSDQISDLISL